MGNKPALYTSDNVINVECETPELLDSGKPRVVSVAFKPLPESLLSIVAGYSSDDNDDTLKYAFLDEQPITLCLSEDVNAKLGSFWYMGFLPAERQWKEQADIKVDKQFLINDYENCLRFLAPDMSNYCRVVVDVLVVNLSNAEDSLSALESLQISLNALLGHLNNVKRAIILIAEHASCCFSFQGPADKATGLSQLFDPQQALCQIVDDLHTCRKMNRTLTAHDLLTFYFNNNDRPASEKYLAKFVISLNDHLSQNFFKKEAPNMISDKIMLIIHLTSVHEIDSIGLDTVRLCHAIHLDTTTLSSVYAKSVVDRLDGAFCSLENRFIERIIINSDHFSRAWQLPRYYGPFTNTISLSALIELSLEIGNNPIQLAELNTGYFANLEHLSFIDTTFTGYLDSQQVPRLRKLKIEAVKHPERLYPELGDLIYKHSQSIICAGRPWQLVATRCSGGWALASYDDPTLNPHDEEKKDAPSPQLLPLIRELMLVMQSQVHAREWQSKLEWGPSLEEITDEHKDCSLVWAPDRVQKITAFGTQEGSSMLAFHEDIPGQRRILASLACHNVAVLLDGVTLQHLRSLNVNRGTVAMYGAFPNLETMSIEKAHFRVPWRVDAPMLESLSCRYLENGAKLSLCPQSLPLLSLLRISPLMKDPTNCPQIVLEDGDIMGLSRVKKVEFHLGMTMSPLFDQFQVIRASHLKLSVEPHMLPACWYTTEWQCVVLELFATDCLYNRSTRQKKPVELILPKLPLVKKLSVIEDRCHVLLNNPMPELIDCTVPSLKSLGPKLKCPKLRCIYFTGKLSESDKKKCLDSATYKAIGAQPRWVYFQQDGEAHRMS